MQNRLVYWGCKCSIYTYIYYKKINIAFFRGGCAGVMMTHRLIIAILDGKGTPEPEYTNLSFLGGSQ